MTEYDYSPEAYERYLNTQRRIANWVDKTEGCRPQFANALSPPSDYLPGRDDDSRHRPSRGRLQRRHSQHFRSRSPSESSCSSDDSGYDDYVHIQPSPPPIRSAPGHLGGSFPAHQLPWNQPPPPRVVSPNRTMPPSYYGTPSYRQVKHRRTHSYAPQVPAPPMQHYPPPVHTPQVVYVSPPVSPGMYGYPAPPQSFGMPPHGRPGPMPVVYVQAPC